MSSTAKPAGDKAAPAKLAGDKAAPAKPAEDKPAEDKPAVRMGSKIVNAPTVPNTGGYENKTVPAKKETIQMAGQNTGGYETRVSQESGQH